jgi:gliding motility-associated lipoprotein GldH
MHPYKPLLFVLLLSALSGCMSSPYYQKQYALQGQAWHHDDCPEFEIDIRDTTCYYNLSFIVRHTDAYPFSNIWLLVSVKQPHDTAFTQTRLELPLADPLGKWMGMGMGEIWEQRVPVTTPGDAAIFSQKGRYIIRLQQNMRLNPLPDILHVGLRVEKSNMSKKTAASAPATP